MNWTDAPELWTLAEVVALTRESIGTAYNKLETARYPIAHLPGVRPYKFPRRNVRAYVERGEVTATIIPSVRGHRRYFRKAVAS